MQHRREEDQSWLRKTWNKATPVIQIGGWLIVAIPAVIGIGRLIQDAKAFDGRLNAVEARQTEYKEGQDLLITKVDTILFFVRKK